MGVSLDRSSTVCRGTALGVCPKTTAVHGCDPASLPPTIDGCTRLVEKFGWRQGGGVLEFGIERDEVSVVSLCTRENQAIERIQKRLLL